MENIIREFHRLPAAEQLKLIKRLETSIGSETKLLSYRADRPHLECVRCQSDRIIKFGSYGNGDKTRYRCKDCKKTFSDFTGTCVYKVAKKHLWMSFVRMMLDNRSIRYIAAELHLSTTTVFNWRHRLLSSLEETLNTQFKGIVETDDVFMRLNQKGRRKGYFKIEKKRGVSDNQVAIVVMADRYRSLDMKVTKLGRIKVEDMKRVVNKSRLNKDNIVCSDMHPTIEAYVKELKLKHEQIKVSAGEHSRDGIYHVNKVNSLTSEFKRWVGRNFVNVSTKYLQNYLNWFEMRKSFTTDEAFEAFLEHSLRNDEAYIKSKNIEDQYQLLLTY